MGDKREPMKQAAAFVGHAGRTSVQSRRGRAAYWLSRRIGLRILGLEQFELGHSNGAGQDHSRIIRLSYHRPDYVRLARRWPQWRLGDEHHGLYQADAGIADPNRANAAHQRLARAHGATLLEHSAVTRL